MKSQAEILEAAKLLWDQEKELEADIKAVSSDSEMAELKASHDAIMAELGRLVEAMDTDTLASLNWWVRRR